MKNEIKFDLFGDNTTIYFDILRLRDVCRITKKNLNQLVTCEADIDVVVSCLMVGLRHYYKSKTEEFYLEKINDFLNDEEKNGTFGDLWNLISLAISASGIFGSKIAKAAVSSTSLVDVAAAIEDHEKNA